MQADIGRPDMDLADTDCHSSWSMDSGIADIDLADSDRVDFGRD
jgi:hypothetical protein